MRQPSRLRDKDISRSVMARHEILHRYNKVKFANSIRLQPLR